MIPAVSQKKAQGTCNPPAPKLRNPNPRPFPGFGAVGLSPSSLLGNPPIRRSLGDPRCASTSKESSRQVPIQTYFVLRVQGLGFVGLVGFIGFIGLIGLIGFIGFVAVEAVSKSVYRALAATGFQVSAKTFFRCPRLCRR